MQNAKVLVQMYEQIQQTKYKLTAFELARLLVSIAAISDSLDFLSFTQKNYTDIVNERSFTVNQEFKKFALILWPHLLKRKMAT